MGGFGSFGKKGGMTISKPRRDRDAQTLNSTDEDEGNYDDEDDEEDRGGYTATARRPSSKPSSPRDPYAYSNRNRPSEFQSSSPTTPTSRAHTLPPALRRTQTSPPTQGGRYVKALYDYATSQPDELPLRVGQVVEVKSEISTDWWTGESEGRSGMFPAAYCEASTPSPTTLASFGAAANDASVPLPPRRMPPAGGAPPSSTVGSSAASGAQRTLPPLTTQSLAPPQRNSSADRDKGYAYNSMDDMTSESEAEGFDDGDHNITASLSGGAQSPASRGLTPNSSYINTANLASGPMGRSRSSTVTSVKKGPAPPPPPSRRSASSTNVLAMASVSSPASGTSSPRARAGTVNSVYNGRLGVPSPMSAGGVGARSLARGGSSMDSSPEGSPFAGPASSGSSRAGSVSAANNVRARARAGTVGAEASPFGVSEDEREILTDDDAFLDGLSGGPTGATSNARAPPARGTATGAPGMTRAMSGLKLPSATDHAGAGASADVGECRDACGCDEFKQNLFKPKGHCASCYHVHEA